MALPGANFFKVIFGGNEQDVTNDGPDDDTRAQALDYNKLSTEIIAIENFIQQKTPLVVINKTGSTITAGTAVAVSGFDSVSGKLTIEKADRGTADFWAVGFVPVDILDGAVGEVVRYGKMPFDTTGFNNGEYLWLDTPSGAVAITPNDIEGRFNQRLARVVDDVGAAGTIFVDPDRGFAPIHSVEIRIGGLAASDDFMMFVVPHQMRIHRIAIASDTATSGSDGSNNYAFQLRNLTDGLNLIAVAQTTQGGELVVDGRLRIVLDQNQVVQSARTLEFQITKNGAPTDLTSAEITLILYYAPVTI